MHGRPAFILHVGHGTEMNDLTRTATHELKSTGIDDSERNETENNMYIPFGGTSDLAIYLPVNSSQDELI
jgi:hypothetical protein